MKALPPIFTKTVPVRALGGGYYEFEACVECGDPHLPENLYEGLCVDCAVKRITPEEFLDYAEEGPDGRALEKFWFRWWYDGLKEPDRYDEALHADIVLLYQMQMEREHNSGKSKLQDRLVEWMRDDRETLGDYIEWFRYKYEIEAWY